MKTFLEILKYLAGSQQILAKLHPNPSLLTFDSRGVLIHDPFKDESNWQTVDPYAYYGDCFLNSSIYQLATVMYENQ